MGGIHHYTIKILERMETSNRYMTQLPLQPTVVSMGTVMKVAKGSGILGEYQEVI